MKKFGQSSFSSKYNHFFDHLLVNHIIIQFFSIIWLTNIWLTKFFQSNDWQTFDWQNFFNCMFAIPIIKSSSIWLYFFSFFEFLVIISNIQFWVWRAFWYVLMLVARCEFRCDLFLQSLWDPVDAQAVVFPGPGRAVCFDRFPRHALSYTEKHKLNKGLHC